MIPKLYTIFASFDLSNFWKADYIQKWDQNVATFWVPAAVAIIFIIMLVQSIIKKKVFLAVLYLILAGACLTWIASGGQHSDVINAVENLAK